MDAINDYYMEELDLSAMKRFFGTRGAADIGKAGLFCAARRTVGACGLCGRRHVPFRADGHERWEHIVGYSFRDSFVAEYTSCLCSRPALADVQAIVRSTLYVLPYEKLRRYWEMSSEHQRLGRVVAEQLFVMTYRRLMDSYCCTPEERYMDLMRRYPELKEQRPLKEIASFIGVTPETVSAIRKNC